MSDQERLAKRDDLSGVGNARSTAATEVDDGLAVARTSAAVIRRQFGRGGASPAPGKRTLVQARYAAQPASSLQQPSIADRIIAAATEGVAGAAGTIPHLNRIQASFGDHDLQGVKAQVGGPAAVASDVMGAEAYATGEQVGFRGQPDLYTAAHETAHVVQQRNGVSLEGGVGQAGDRYERQADEVADRVVRGQPAGDLLSSQGDAPHPTMRRAELVQRKSREVEVDLGEIPITAPRPREKVHDLGALPTITGSEEYMSTPKYQKCQNWCNAAAIYVIGYAANASDGINSFSDRMKFASSADAKSDVLGAVFKEMIYKGIDIAFSAVPAVRLFAAGVRGAGKEIERAGKAAVEVDVMTFIGKARNELGELRTRASEIAGNVEEVYGKAVEDPGLLRLLEEAPPTLAALIPEVGQFELWQYESYMRQTQQRGSRKLTPTPAGEGHDHVIEVEYSVAEKRVIRARVTGSKAGNLADGLNATGPRGEGGGLDLNQIRCGKRVVFWRDQTPMKTTALLGPGGEVITRDGGHHYQDLLGGKLPTVSRLEGD